MKEQLTTCKACGTEIAKTAKTCPKCGAKNKKPFYKKPLLWVIVAVIVIFMAIPSGGSDNDTADEQDSNATASQTDTTKTDDQEAVEPEETVSKEYKNALKKAESYAKTLHMSKAAIYDQLTSEYGEQFPADAAQYAIDNLEFDWNANALEKAKSYQETMSMSKSAIYDQLISEYGEQFTAEEAQYAIDHLED